MGVLKIKRGDNERLKAVVKPSSTVASGIFFMAKRYLTDIDANAIITKSIGAGIIVTLVGTDGDPNALPPIPAVPAELQISISGSETQVLPNQTTTLQYELEDGGGHTLDTGTLVVAPEVRLA